MAQSTDEDGKKGWHEVRVRATVPRLLDVDMQNQAFTAELKLEATWEEDDEDLLKIMERRDDLEGLDKAASEKDLDKLKKRDYRLLQDWCKKPCSSTQYQIEVPDNSLSAEQNEPAPGEPPPSAAIRSRSKTEVSLAKQLANKRFFTPRLSITNLVKTEKEEMWYSFKRIDAKTARVSFIWLLTGRFQDRLKLRSFPFDVQDLRVDLKAGHELQPRKKGATGRPVLLVKNQDAKAKSVISVNTFVQASEYVLSPRLMFEQCESNPEGSSSSLTYSRLVMKMRVTRKSTYWIFAVGVPLFIVTTSLFSTFVLPLDETNDRLAASVTILLAMVAFKTYVSDKLPNIGYLSRIDKCAEQHSKAFRDLRAHSPAC